MMNDHLKNDNHYVSILDALYLWRLVMNNNEVENYFFDDPALDNMERFDVCLRSALIERRITKTEYLKMEKLRLQIYNLFDEVSDHARNEFREVLNNI